MSSVIFFHPFFPLFHQNVCDLCDFLFFIFLLMLAGALVQLNVALSMEALWAFFFFFFFYNLGALIYKGFFFFLGQNWRLNSPKGWAGPGCKGAYVFKLLPAKAFQAYVFYISI